MIDSILIATFLSFPEAILMLMLGLSLCDIKVLKRKVVLIALIQGCIAFIVQLLKIPFGVHSITQMLTFWILVTFILNIKWYKAIVPVLIGYFIDSVIQEILISVVTAMVELDFTRLGTEFKYTFIYGSSVLIVSVTVLLIIRKFNFTFCDLSVEGETVGEQK